ncbi:MAG TPA: hypothetical protein PL085_11560 [Agriterribacter sp.]|uniref:DUF6706 family protein n=1 Tax=Agriterribacter sp. TaxID=2821509 RepID=UPI002CAC5FB9|nr:DUF6706 family protein [Agriterribacter sp.]HRQ17706.1 hypothetical protein [Agriterribacter sp.]
MTISEYITASLGRFGVSSSDVSVLLDDAGLTGADAVNDSNRTEVKRAMFNYIPLLLAGSGSVSEGGYSISYNISGIKTWYSFMAKELGLEDKLKPTVKDATNRW